MLINSYFISLPSTFFQLFSFLCWLLEDLLIKKNKNKIQGQHIQPISLFVEASLL